MSWCLYRDMSKEDQRQVGRFWVVADRHINCFKVIDSMQWYIKLQSKVHHGRTTVISQPLRRFDDCRLRDGFWNSGLGTKFLPQCQVISASWPSTLQWFESWGSPAWDAPHSITHHHPYSPTFISNTQTPPETSRNHGGYRAEIGQSGRTSAPPNCVNTSE